MKILFAVFTDGTGTDFQVTVDVPPGVNPVDMLDSARFYNSDKSATPGMVGTIALKREAHDHSSRAIADDYGVCRSSIHSVVTGDTWALPPEQFEMPFK